MEKPIQNQPPQTMMSSSQQQIQPTFFQPVQQSQQATNQIQPLHNHVLFELSSLESRDEFEERTQRTYHMLKQMINNKSHKECHEIYTKFISSDPQKNNEDLTLGLLVAILIEQDCLRYYKDAVSMSKDNLGVFGSFLNIIIERWTKLREPPKKQILWITNQLMKSNVSSAELVCCGLTRQTAGGDLSPKNIWLIENLLELLIENRNWLTNSTNFMVPTIIYTLMRLIADHMGLSQATLRQKEVDFVMGLIREKFPDCMQIGRDFLRLLFNIVKIPEFEKLWHDIFNDPKSLSPSFQNYLQLLSTRTPRRLIQSRLTFDMERKISFLATQVKFGNQKRYQDWFHKQYLSTPESLSLRCDLIRYICTVIHPSNEVLCSDIIPRWAIIGWLLATCTTGGAAVNCRLALFLDWLLFDPRTESIMNIEPGILVMYYSLRQHPNVTANLLDFLCKIPVIFTPKSGEHIKLGIKRALHNILEKRVVQSLAPLFDNQKHDTTLKALLKETFPEFCVGSNTDSTTPQHQQPSPIPNPLSSPISTSSLVNTPPASINIAPSLSSDTLNGSNRVLIKTQPDISNIAAPSEDSVFAETPLDVKPNLIVASSDNQIHITLDTSVSNSIDAIEPQGGSSPPVVTCPTSAAPPVTSNNILSATKEDHKSTNWNGTNDNTADMTSSDSHKTQQPSSNHDNKIRKLSVSNSDHAEVPMKKGKKLSSSSQENDSLVSKNSNLITANSNTINSTPTGTPATTSCSTLSSNTTSSTTSQLSTTSSTVSPSFQFSQPPRPRSPQSPPSPPDSMSQTPPSLDDYITDLNREPGSSSSTRVIYPFMIVPDLYVKATLDKFDEPIRRILEDLAMDEYSNQTRCELMERLISLVFENGELSSNANLHKSLAHYLATVFVNDYTTRIFPSSTSMSSQDTQALEESISTPLFTLCRKAFFSVRLNSASNSPSYSSSNLAKPMSLLVSISKLLEATGFLVLYFLRVNTILNGTGVAGSYVEFCNSGKRKLSKCLYDDLYMASTYDPEMFCFMLPIVFGELATCGAFSVTGNIDLVRLVVSSIDPMYLQELVCLCLPGTAKVINKEDVMPLIEASLSWESWEQYAFWKLISAQSVPIENYINILPKLECKANSEAITCILLNLQRVTEPTMNMLKQLINCEYKPNNPFISSILRYWSIKTEVKDLAKMITSLVDIHVPMTPVKRKAGGQVKSRMAGTLSMQSERVLHHLNSIRLRAPKNKLLAQQAIVEMISHLEEVCNDNQKRQFADLFSNRSMKKQKKSSDKEVS